MSPETARLQLQIAELKRELEAIAKKVGPGGATPFGILPGVKVRPASVGTDALQAGALAATAPGRAIMASGYFDAATALDKFAAGAIARSRLGALGIVNADVDAAAAIAYSKLSLTGSVQPADLSFNSRGFYSIWDVAVAGAGTRYIPVNGMDLNGQATEEPIKLVIDSAMTLKKLRLRVSRTSLAAGNTAVYTVRKTGGDTALTVTVDNSKVVGDELTVAADVALVAGDELSASVVYNSANDIGASVSLEAA